jgi:hypothetical protein
VDAEMKGDRRSGGGGGGGGSRLLPSSTGIGTGKDLSISTLRDVIRRYGASGVGGDASELSSGQTRRRGIVWADETTQDRVLQISMLASRVSALV